MNASLSYRPPEVPDDGHVEEDKSKESKFLKYAIPAFIVTFVLIIMIISFLVISDNNDKIFSSRADKTKYNTVAGVTAKCFFDISINNSAVGRLVIGLFGDQVPLTVRNFKELCSGSFGTSKISGRPLTYKGSKFYKITTNVMAQGGDITYNNGGGGESIYGKPFADENYILNHSVPYLLSMYSAGTNHNTS
jgi:hypothetical protein